MKFLDRFKKWMSKNHIEEKPEKKVPSPRPAMNNNLTIRTASIYPKNSIPKGEREGVPAIRKKPNFKFPLIPDQMPDKPGGAANQKNEIDPVFKPRKSKRVSGFAFDHKTNPSISANKSRFRPTQVISPIYGYNRPKPKPKMENQPEEKQPVVLEKSPIQVALSVQDKNLTLNKANENPVTENRASVAQEEQVQIEKPQAPSPVIVEDRPEPSIPIQTKETETVSHKSGDFPYRLPHLGLLKSVPYIHRESSEKVKKQQEKLAETLRNFHVNAEVIGAVQGPAVTRFEIQPAAGVKVNKITNLADDLKLSLAARDIRIEAPIPGRSAIGIEVPNENSRMVYLKEIIASEAFQRHSSPLTVALGVDIGGNPVVADLATMPHGLIAGATGSGKSVCIHSLILSLLFKAAPEQVRLLLIDPKMVELAPYNRLPHLVTPVVTDPKQATAALKWAVEEMDRRYVQFAEAGVRDLSRYNDLMRRAYPGENRTLPSIVIIIDELADLMMVAPHDVEEAICRIAQKARACGIHLLVATQRPSVDVITGLIKANIPARIAFSVSSQMDSRTILDMGGAERLLGRGDMLYMGSGSSKPVRLQGPFVSEEEIERVTAFIKNQREPDYLFEKEALTVNMAGEETDDLFPEAVRFCVENGQASASSLQRNFRIGYNRAARLIEMMEARGFISEQSGSKPRDVYITLEEYEEIFMKSQ